MKHLMKINELFKSTYLSASKELGSRHQPRVDKLISWAGKRGEDNKQERVYSHRFIFDGSYENEYFFITSISHSIDKRVLSVSFGMKSNWDRDKRIYLNFDILNPGTHRVEESYLRLASSDIFENKDVVAGRKNANHLLRCFNEYWRDELSGEDQEFEDYTIKGFSVNRLYKTNV